MGYHRAGFDVTGVDNRPQPRYPFTFIQGDAMTFPLDGFDMIHASPPCTDHTSMGPRTSGTAWMLAATRNRLSAQDTPWIIENVLNAPMRADFLLCGAMFGLRTYRHRRFELDPRWPALLALPAHPRHRIPASRGANGGRVAAYEAGLMISVSSHNPNRVSAACLDIDWMAGSDELGLAIPPAYTEYIGAQLLDHLRG